ncbi:hypothetical protein [Staphylococcus massiliensis]|uniref:Pathogenicity island protein n=1 Tax=Staphylococcus massiliensis S46 TaxID=1229783 RepID=K9B9B3_9STAP|nr:hypothetical protein [Staphylococcus massiliensis]EKU50340.1 pathogenicity island protein [Staphylococcus massiliensis S46]
MKIDENERDYHIKQLGLLTGYFDEIYTVDISRYSKVFLEKLDDGRWWAWRERYEDGRMSCINYKSIAYGEFETVIERLRSYLEFINKM